MKKASTVTGKQLRNFVQGQRTQPRLTVGLDLGDRHSWYCVLDEAGQIRQEQRVRTNAKTLREVFGALPGSRIALETGTHSPWISRLLSGLGHEVIVANARKVRLIGESRLTQSGDTADRPSLYEILRIPASASAAELRVAFKLRDLELKSAGASHSQRVALERAFNIVGMPDVRDCYYALLADPEAP